MDEPAAALMLTTGRSVRLSCSMSWQNPRNPNGHSRLLACETSAACGQDTASPLTSGLRPSQSRTSGQTGNDW